MSIAEQIKQDVTTAMKAGDRDRAQALRLILSELQKDQKEGADDEEAVLRRERKRRLESASTYKDAGREELEVKEVFEAELISSYLPQELSDEETSALVAAAIEETGASSPKDMGNVIKAVLAKADGRANGGKVSALVKQSLLGK